MTTDFDVETKERQLVTYMLALTCTKQQNFPQTVITKR